MSRFTRKYRARDYVALENTVHDRLDKGVDAGYCVHGLQLLFFELFTGFTPENKSLQPFICGWGFFPDSSAAPRGRGTQIANSP